MGRKADSDSFPAAKVDILPVLEECDSTLSPVQSPRKCVKSRKRKRKDNSNDARPSTQHAFVMKLFGRSVDLAQFEGDSPLYPICRAWIHNYPLSQATPLKADSPSVSPSNVPVVDIEGKYDIYHLPEPDNDELLSLDIDSKIPVPLYRLSDIPEVGQNAGGSYPTPEQLLQDHLVRWKEVKNVWRQTAFRTEQRHSASLSILQEMFERNIKED